MVNCSNCGFEVGESKFCPNCGTRVVDSSSVVLCSNCGFEVGESKFCPNCGVKVGESVQNIVCSKCGEDAEPGDVFCNKCGTKLEINPEEHICPNCGKVLSESSKFCPYCGYSEENNQENSWVDEVIEADDEITGIVTKGLFKSRLINKVHDKTASTNLKGAKRGFSNTERKYWQKTEPVFLEVYDSINDEFIRAIFWLERNKLGGVGGSALGLAAAVLTPTKDMSHKEGLQFYRNMLNKVTQEVNSERQKGNFDEVEFFKIKFRESTNANHTSLGVPKAIKTWRKNKK